MRLRGVNNLLSPYAAWRRSFFVTLFFVTLASFLFWLDSFRIYEAEVRVLTIAKSQSAATDQVVENFAELTSNLSFYERMLSENDLIDDDFEGYSQDKRKALWNEVVTVKRSEKSGVLIVVARQDTKEKSKRLAEATVKTLFSVAGFYYNIKTDIDLRVVDETIIKPALSQPLWYAATSLGSAFGATVLFFLFLSVTPFFFRKKQLRAVPLRIASSETEMTGKPYQDFAVGAAVPYIDPGKFVPTRPKALSFESSHEEQQIREEILAPITKAQAPVNLPVASSQSEKMLPGMDVENLPFEFEEVQIAPPLLESVAAEPSVPPASIKSGEPTIEEYKRRLNELLSGGK